MHELTTTTKGCNECSVVSVTHHHFTVLSLFVTTVLKDAI